MKVSFSWLKELVDYQISDKELVDLLPLRTIGTKDITEKFVELDMKGYNRADLLSLRGVAYEVAAITDARVKFTEDEPDFDQLFSDKKDFSVEIRDTNLCPLYTLTKIEGLKIRPSPKEWVEKLESSGMRSVNNLTDITNLIMLEFGQPLHAFNVDQIKETVIVRTAQEGEKLTTLDGKSREFLPSDLLIADKKQVLGIAGVMGGKSSEVTNSTTTILLEAAIFDPKNLRQTATRLGLISEAGKRFYHGLTKKRLYQALSAAIKMYQELGGVVVSYSIEDNLDESQSTIEVSQEKINSLIGINIPPDQVVDYLTKLNFKIDQSGDIFKVTPPYWRLDINIPEDIVEEIARMYGYEKIPAQKLSGELPEKVDQSLFENIYEIKKTLVELGLTEVQTYSFYSTEVINNLDLSVDNLIKVANPISKETEYLRNHLWPNLIEVIGKNIKKHNLEDIAIFEIGKIYSVGPKESYKISIALTNGSNNPMAELNQILTKADLETENQILEGNFFHPTRQLGALAEIHSRILNRFGISKRVAAAEIDLEKLSPFN